MHAESIKYNFVAPLTTQKAWSMIKLVGYSIRSLVRFIYKIEITLRALHAQFRIFVLNISALPEFLISNGIMFHSLETEPEFISIYKITGKVECVTSSCS